MIIICDICDEELTEQGALLFSPPNINGFTRKIHICISCYKESEAIRKGPKGHSTIQDHTYLIYAAAEYARSGTDTDIAIATALRKCYDDLKGNPLPPKGMHTN